ncbi:hypothetical protein Taro_000682, partial [Colocasia esculenta]|nr:hypothetical protein [Colocasia esculenta]
GENEGFGEATDGRAAGESGERSSPLPLQAVAWELDTGTPGAARLLSSIPEHGGEGGGETTSSYCAPRERVSLVLTPKLPWLAGDSAWLADGDCAWLTPVTSYAALWKEADMWKEVVKIWIFEHWVRWSEVNRKNKGVQKIFHCVGTQTFADIYKAEEENDSVDGGVAPKESTSVTKQDVHYVQLDSKRQIGWKKPIGLLDEKSVEVLCRHHS